MLVLQLFAEQPKTEMAKKLSLGQSDAQRAEYMPEIEAFEPEMLMKLVVISVI